MSTTHVICPECGAKNAIPAERLNDKPRCGKCKTLLFNAHPVALDQAGFNRHVSGNDIPVLVDFWAPWCAPCRAMAPAFESAAAQLEPGMRLAKLNTEEEQGVGARYNIRSIPTLVMFHKGREVARQSGAMAAGDIVRWARAQLQG
jgi:thioredoxin 2